MVSAEYPVNMCPHHKVTTQLARQARSVLKVVKGIHWLVCLQKRAQILAQSSLLCFPLSYTN